MSFPDFCEKVFSIKLYDYQRRLAQMYDKEQFVIFTKFRNGGFTTLSVLWAIWRCLHNADQSILIGFNRDRYITSYVSPLIVRKALRELQGQVERQNDHFIGFTNGSKIYLRSMGTDRRLNALWTYEAQQDLRSQHNIYAEQELTSILAQEINQEIDREVLNDLRSNAGTVATYNFSTTAAWDFSTVLTHLIIDEAAFHSNMKTHWLAVYPCISETGKAFVYSTPNGSNNWFERTYYGKNNFKLFQASYKEHPDYSEEKVEQLKKDLGENGWRQEFLQEFLHTEC